VYKKTVCKVDGKTGCKNAGSHNISANKSRKINDAGWLVLKKRMNILDLLNSQN